MMTMARHKYAGTPWLYDETTGDIVGVKDPDGSEFYFARAANYGLFRDMDDQTALANTPTAITFDTPLIDVRSGDMRVPVSMRTVDKLTT